MSLRRSNFLNHYGAFGRRRLEESRLTKRDQQAFARRKLARDQRLRKLLPKFKEGHVYEGRVARIHRNVVTVYLGEMPSETNVSQVCKPKRGERIWVRIVMMDIERARIFVCPISTLPARRGLD